MIGEIKVERGVGVRHVALGGVLALVSSVAIAQVSFPNGTFNESSVELRVKVAGGSVDLTRQYFEGSWQVNPQWNALKLTIDPIDSSVKLIERNGNKYEKRSDAWVLDSGNLIRAQNVLVLTPTTSEGTAPADISSTTPETTLAGSLATTSQLGYRWSDRRGNWIEYDTQGRVASYGDRNNVRVWLQRDSGGVLERIRDHFGRTVITVSGNTYTDRPGFYGATGTARSVTIGGGHFTDLLGNTSLITYKDVAVGYSVTYDGGQEAGRTIIKESRPTGITDPEGHVRSFGYGPTGRVSTVTHADGSVTTYVYDYTKLKKEFYLRATTKAPAGVTAPDRVEETWYDDQGRIIRQDIAGQTLFQSRKLDTRTREETDARGLKTLVVRDEFENVTSTVYPDGAQTTAKYDPVYSNVLEEVDEFGVKTKYEYDVKGNLTRKTEAVGLPDERITEYTVDAFGNRLTVKSLGDANTVEAVTTARYDNRGNIRQVVDAEQRLTSYEHDMSGKVVKRTDGRLHDWTRLYNAKGWLLSETNPLQETVNYEYNKVGKVTKVTDARGKRRTYRFNEVGLVREIENHLGAKASAAYSAGVVNSYTSWDGGVTRFEQDQQGRRSKIIDAKGNATIISYADEAGVVGGGSEPFEIAYPTFKKRYVRDEMGRIILSKAIFDGQERSATFGYDKKGRLVTFSDAEGNQVRRYNSYGQVSSGEDRFGNGFEHTYDARGNRITLRDYRGNLWRFEYDRTNNVTKQIDPLNRAVRYIYDASGNVAETLNARGHRMVYTRNDANRLIGIQAYDETNALTQTQTFAYDANGNLITWTDSNGSAGTLEYDDLNRLLSETVSYGSTSLSYSYTYHPSGKLRTVTYPGAFTLTYSYDAHGELQAVDVPGEGSISASEWKWRMPTKTITPGGTVRDETYNGLLQLTEARIHAPNQQLLMDMANVFSNRADLVSRVMDGVSHNYEYDKEERLTRATGAVTQVYTIDAGGNRLTSGELSGEWIYDAANQLASHGSIVYEYDLAGNRVRKVDSSYSEPQRTTSYIYDSFNRLVEVRSGNGTTIARYAYDPLNRRLSKTVDGETTLFLHGREGLLVEATHTGNAQVMYGWRPDRAFGAAPLLIKRGAAIGYYHNDHLGTPLRITDRLGIIAWAASYDAFGRATEAANPALQSNLRLPGQYEDRETGLHYNWHRYYDNSTGRYITSDPIGLRGGLNAYTYAKGNPNKFVDPKGLFTPDVHFMLSSNAALRAGCGFGSRLKIAKETVKVDFPTGAFFGLVEDGYDGTQLPANSAWHCMSDGSKLQTTEEGARDFQEYIAKHKGGCSIRDVARVLHATQDCFSPAHEEFEPWYGEPPSTPWPEMIEHGLKDFFVSDETFDKAEEASVEALKQMQENCPCLCESL